MTTTGVVPAPIGHPALGVVGVGELVTGQDFSLRGREERLPGGVVETRPNPSHRLTNPVIPAQFGEVVRTVGRAPIGVEDDLGDGLRAAADRDLWRRSGVPLHVA